MYKKGKMKGGQGCIKDIGDNLARFLMGIIFLVMTVMSRNNICHVNHIFIESSLDLITLNEYILNELKFPSELYNMA